MLWFMRWGGSFVWSYAPCQRMLGMCWNKDKHILGVLETAPDNTDALNGIHPGKALIHIPHY